LTGGDAGRRADMRKIEFRGKWKNNGKWVYGCYIKADRKEYIYVEGETIFDTGRAEIIPDTVGQYTGIKDKNGVMIFDGDIVQGRVFGKCLVFWNDLAAAFFIKRTDDIRHPMQSLLSYTVIGNIHDNPELLGRENGA
jgi:uncharacterized phage protein (TIGR01671 family)